MTARPELVPVTLLAAFLFGFSLRLVGLLRPFFADRSERDERCLRGLLSGYHLAMIPAMLIAGILVDHLGGEGMLLIGTFLGVVGLFALTRAASFRGTRYSLLVLGWGQACLGMAAITLMPRALIESSETASVDLGFAFIGLGAAIAPAAVRLLFELAGVRRTLGIAAVLLFVPAVAAFLTPAGAFHDRAAVPTWLVLGRPSLWVAALIFMLYAPVEGAIGTWGPAPFAEDTVGGAGPGAAFWLSFLGSRLVFAFLHQQELALFGQYGEPWLVCLLALLAAVAIANGIGARYRTNARAGWLLAGALLGPILPAVVGFLFKRFPADRGLALGAAFAIGTAGSLAVSPFFGAVARRRGLRKAMVLPTVFAVLLAAAALVLAMEQELP